MIKQQATPTMVPSGQSPEPVLSATVLLLRDTPAAGGNASSLEVLLLERHLNSDFAGGALVFPGGKVDASDHRLEDARWSGPALDEWRTLLGVGSSELALALLVTAVRETFEESGVLLAHRDDGTPITDQELRTPSFAQARSRLQARGQHWDWSGWLRDERLVLDLGRLAFWSWWVTPEGQHRRFDTRFFAALMPAGQTADHDDLETTSMRWCAPAEALEAQARGEFTVIFPTRCNLRDLAHFSTAADAWDAAHDGEVDQRRIQPSMVRVDGRLMVQHPYLPDPEPV
ncbi:MAG: hypothetical protein JJU06_11750 [Ectothiorhodospiraceae bacterium]|nr:hypothetical protein [Ectothiorhodospiraceae bacterium]MCH8502871.1 hypothetical protein [Ectothiorhodospiraceae bacterium]